MKVKPRYFHGAADDDPDAWIEHIEAIFKANQWDEDDVRIAKAVVAQRGVAERWQASHPEFFQPGYTWEQFRETFLARWRPEDFADRLVESIFSTCQFRNEPVKDYAERFGAAVRLAAGPQGNVVELQNKYRT